MNGDANADADLGLRNGKHRCGNNQARSQSDPSNCLERKHLFLLGPVEPIGCGSDYYNTGGPRPTTRAKTSVHLYF